MEQRELNFFDLCVACGRAIGRGIVAGGHLLAHMCRLTYRYWWVVLTLVVLAIAAAFYQTRKGNLTYRANAIVLLNGASIQQFEQAYSPLRSGLQLPAEEAITPLVKNGVASRFETFRVIDCLRDGYPDYVDFKQKSSPTDTIRVQMQDRLCLQFQIKERNMAQLPEIERAMLAYLNGNIALQQSYVSYLDNLRKEVEFNHSQVQKLDSLTSEYYFHNHLGEQPLSGVGTGFIWTGDWRVHLFLKDIYKHQEYTKLTDYRMQLATAPVVLENHFAAAYAPVNGRMKMLVLYFLLGWIGGCILAELIDKRKSIADWLKK